jgi:glutamate-1-semialdehyde 2,1-aminomutase
MHAARANLRTLTENHNAAFAHIWHIANRLCTGLEDLFHQHEIPAIVQRVGPMLQITFTQRPAIRDYRELCEFVDREAYRGFVKSLFEFGIYTTPSAALHSIVTLAHSEADVDFTLDAVERSLSAKEGAVV